MEGNTFTSIPIKEKVSIEISGGFYYRLQALLTEYSKDVPEDRMISVLKKIQNQKYGEDIWAYNFETLLILIHEIEHKFIEEGKTEEKPIPEDFSSQMSTQD